MYAMDPQSRAMGAGRELFACRKDGSAFAVEVALSPMATDDGLFVLASVVDISARRALERATAEQRDELAHLSRVAMLAELAGSLAHELNQPLTAILSNAQAARFLAQSPPRVDQIDEILADIVKSDHRARAVIQRLAPCCARRVKHQALTSTTWSRIAAPDAQRSAQPRRHARHRARARLPVSGDATSCSRCCSTF
jgi:C4-dicarboxylate-specific signal transduction histidine kinase